MVDLVDRRDRDNATPLMHASACLGTIEKIRALLSAGANANAVDRKYCIDVCCCFR